MLASTAARLFAVTWVPAQEASGVPDAPPLTAAEFDGLMRAVGPFEARPRLAVAVSGGSDSLALALLLDRWARRRHGTVVALTVDHGLRRGAAAEARRAGSWLAARGIAHRLLRWRPSAAAGDLRGGLQAAARGARYRLLADCCRREQILHLAIAHHRDDQAETFLLRLGRGSGLDGLAAMSPVTGRDGVRLVRPLLGIGRQRLAATLRRFRQPWIEDPSNRNPAHARVRMRALLPALAGEGVTSARLAATAGHLGRARVVLDDATAALLAAAAAADPAGFVRLDPAALFAAPAELSRRALAQCLMTVGGGDYAPRFERLARLHDALRVAVHGGARRGATLAGCRILWIGETLLICREPALAAGELPVRRAAPLRWDNRFVLRVAGTTAGLTLRRLGGEGWRQVAAAAPRLRDRAPPAPVRPGLPALWDAAGVVTVPHLEWCRANRHLTVTVAWMPAQPLAGSRFTVA